MLEVVNKRTNKANLPNAIFTRIEETGSEDQNWMTESIKTRGPNIIKQTTKPEGWKIPLEYE